MQLLVEKTSANRRKYVKMLQWYRYLACWHVLPTLNKKYYTWLISPNRVEIDFSLPMTKYRTRRKNLPLEFFIYHGQKWHDLSCYICRNGDGGHNCRCVERSLGGANNGIANKQFKILPIWSKSRNVNDLLESNIFGSK